MAPIIQLQPHDEHNQRLEANVHPPGWKNPQPQEKYNLVVIGAGTAGLVAAAGAAGIGAKVALIERELMGGDCLNVGCVPSKGLLSAARIAATVRQAAEYGVLAPGDVLVDFPAVMERMRRIRADISPHDSAQRFTDLGIDVFLGQGEFKSSDTIVVDGAELKFSKAVIATGARASAPPIEGLDTVQYLTNESLFSLTELPPRLGIIGAGPIGCEMAQAFARFGSEVFLVESAHGVLPREDADAALLVEQALAADDVKLLCCGRETKIVKDGDKIRIQLNSHDEPYDVQVDQLLVAVGRAPNVEGLNLEGVGVEFDNRGVKVNDRFQTTNSRIYAAGDICSKYQFTHAADFMARAVIRNALFMGNAKESQLVVPWCTYTSPELAQIGVTEADAGSQGLEYDVYTQPLSGVDRAILDSETTGFVKVITKKGTGKILGATIVATNAGDLIGEMSVAMTNGLSIGQVGNSIHPYPTQAEAIRRVGDQYSRTRLTPFVKGLFDKWLKWSR